MYVRLPHYHDIMHVPLLKIHPAVSLCDCRFIQKISADSKNSFKSINSFSPVILIPGNAGLVCGSLWRENARDVQTRHFTLQILSVWINFSVRVTDFIGIIWILFEWDCKHTLGSRQFKGQADLRYKGVRTQFLVELRESWGWVWLSERSPWSSALCYFCGNHRAWETIWEEKVTTLSITSCHFSHVWHIALKKLWH